jgi:hypothetical protein
MVHTNMHVLWAARTAFRSEDLESQITGNLGLMFGRDVGRYRDNGLGETDIHSLHVVFTTTLVLEDNDWKTHR